MKSIIEQASSIMKAIEKAWNQADKPKEFSIKIFEKEERNFFGMTIKPAKVGIFFTDKPTVPEKPTTKARPDVKECRDEAKPSAHKQPVQTHKNPVHTSENSAINQRKSAPTRQQQAPVNNNPTTDLLSEKPRRVPASWNDAMINSTETWLKKTLSLMGMHTVTFTKEIIGKNLKLTFNIPLIADVTHEKQLFRSFAHLIMSSLRNQYKQEIKDLKVILIRPE